MADAGDSKSPALNECEGSNPSSGTTSWTYPGGTRVGFYPQKKVLRIKPLRDPSRLATPSFA
jgi:hypothetical protein